MPPVASGLADPLDRLAGELHTDPAHPLRLAVRSSGVAEDSAAASFAGLHDTELDLTADEVPAAILRCWASLWSDRAIGYRTRRGLPLDGGAMAVVIQALVPALAAAVAFTRHPVTGEDDRILVNAAPGLGEAMVSGLVTPDTIVIDKADRTVIEFTPGDQPGGAALTTRPSPTSSICASTSSVRSARRSTSKPRSPPTAGTSSRPDRSPPAEEPHDVRRDTTTDAFPIAWQEPEDAELTWEWDDMHMPTAVTPLAGDYNVLMGSGFAYGYERLSVPYEVLTRVWNSYTYFAWRMHVPESERAAAEDRYTQARRAAIPTSAAYWETRRHRALARSTPGSRPARSKRPSRPTRGRGLGRGVAAGSAAPGRSTSTRSAARTR